MPPDRDYQCNTAVVRAFRKTSVNVNRGLAELRAQLGMREREFGRAHLKKLHSMPSLRSPHSSQRDVSVYHHLRQKKVRD